MIIKLNMEAVQQLNMIMNHTGYTNPTHCVQVMLSQVNNKIQLAKKPPQHRRATDIIATEHGVSALHQAQNDNHG